MNADLRDTILFEGFGPAEGDLDVWLVVRIRVVFGSLGELLGDDEFVQGDQTLIHLFSDLHKTLPHEGV